MVGRSAASVEGYNYSQALRRSGLTWTEENLHQFLAKPSQFVHGTKMIYAGLSKPEDRQNVIAFLAARSQPATRAAQQPTAQTVPPAPHEETEAAPADTAPTAPAAAEDVVSGPADYTATVRYALKSGIAEGRMVFIGVGGDIDGVVNPRLTAPEGAVVQVTLINGEGAEHDFALDQPNVRSQHVVGQGGSTTVAFRAGAVGETK